MIAVEQVVAATKAPEANVHVSWPALYAALEKYKIATTLTECAMIATVAVETAGTFKPVSEYGEHPEYDTGRLAARLGNTPEADGDGQYYEGRGFIQLTGRSNYRAYGKLIGVALWNKPTLALDPAIAAELAAVYFKAKKVNIAANERRWQDVRRLVNGGLNGWQRFYDILQRLGAVT